MNDIPKIIHQIWSGIEEPLPEHFRQFSETWKACHPDWEYQLWDNDRMNVFINDHYPAYWDTYLSFQYNIQRWDAIRYLILDKIGGMYLDFDIDCLRPHDSLIQGHTCCFSSEPDSHGKNFKKSVYFNNALMASIPGHPFMQKIIKTVFSYIPKMASEVSLQKFMEVMTTTGPWVLTELYEKYPEKEQIYLIPAELVSPYDVTESQLIRKGYELKGLDRKLVDAYSVHYFFSDWAI